MKTFLGFLLTFISSLSYSDTDTSELKVLQEDFHSKTGKYSICYSKLYPSDQSTWVTDSHCSIKLKALLRNDDQLTSLKDKAFNVLSMGMQNISTSPMRLSDQLEVQINVSQSTSEIWTHISNQYDKDSQEYADHLQRVKDDGLIASDLTSKFQAEFNRDVVFEAYLVTKIQRLGIEKLLAAAESVSTLDANVRSIYLVNGSGYIRRGRTMEIGIGSDLETFKMAIHRFR